MAAALWDLQRCVVSSSSSCGFLASVPGCCKLELSGEPSRRSAFSVCGVPNRPRRELRGEKRLSTRVATRSLYSPLVESFGTPQRKLPGDGNPKIDLNDSGAWRTSSPADTRSQQTEAGSSEVDEGTDSIQSAPQDPLTISSEEGAHAEKLADFDMKKGARGRPRARARPPSMSLSQGFSSVSRRAVTHTAGAVGHPLNSSKVPGPIGFVMAFAVAVLGVKTAVEKQGLLPGTPQKICEKCEGYGVQQCHVCKGRGVLNWEGKLRRTDPCPLCIGSCVKKCSTCGGVKSKKGLPSAMMSQSGSNEKKG